MCAVVTNCFPVKRCCRLCNSPAYMVFEDSRPFYVCKKCGLIFTGCYLSPEETTKHYQSQYGNIIDWNKEATAILNLVSFAVTPLNIFDFGSGSGLLAAAFRSMGFEVGNYEPMLHGDFRTENYDSSYDLVILNEVIEHVEDVMQTFDNICSVTKPGSVIFISTMMTDIIINEPGKFQETFSNWWYKDDPTHVSFFCQLVFESICAMEDGCKLQLLFAGTNGVILQRVQ